MNHNTDLTIYKMVSNRLPFLADTQNNQGLISNFTLEVMYELEPCFRIDKDLPETEDTRVGNEDYYSIAQRAVIADIICCYVLLLKMVGNLGGVATDGQDGVSDGRIMTRAKAGSVEVEWGQFDVAKGGLVTSADKLFGLYRKSAIRKARALNCAIDICEDCTTSVECLLDKQPHHFKVVTSRCGGSIKNIPERGL